jgi:outer membrane protein assembly factor BamB
LGPAGSWCEAASGDNFINHQSSIINPMPLRVGSTIPGVVVLGVLLIGGSSARAQWDPLGSDSGQYQLSDTVQLDRAGGEVASNLQQAEAYLADRQWDEAVRILRRVMENSPQRLWPVTNRRYITVRDYCHMRLAALPPEALALYRARVDPAARKGYEQGVARRDRGLLLNVVNEALASSWGDDALLALGEMALERGDHAAARAYWEKIIPARQPSAADAPTRPRTWLAFPDTELDVAAVRARLVLVSILEGSPNRAREELAAFARLHPGARGRLGGRDVDYAKTLRTILAQSADWPRPEPCGDWPTFAGSASRNKIAPSSVDPGGVAWRIRLREDGTAPASLSFHPVVVGNLVLVNNRVEILAIDPRTGKPAWGQSGGVIYRDELAGVHRREDDAVETLGRPRFTMTARDGRLYARMGSTVTSRPTGATASGGGGCLVCIDLEAEGRLLWKIPPEGDGWAFEGSPLCDGTNVYVALRRSDIRPQAHVACYDAQTGRRRWRRFVCAADTPAQGVFAQRTHNLLTLRRETIYYNTNLGAVAALSTHDGRVQWISLYPRVRLGDLLRPEPYTARDLNPCVYHRGTLLVAPSDSRRILALDAATGRILWQTGSQVQDVVHLLGTSGDQLIAAGKRLYWISLRREDPGRVRHAWPHAPKGPGYGRGVLAGGRVWWPSREKIFVFDQTTARLEKVIELGPKGAAGGNLLLAAGHLLITTDKELIALGQHGHAPPNGSEVTRLAGRPGRDPAD